MIRDAFYSLAHPCLITIPQHEVKIVTHRCNLLISFSVFFTLVLEALELTFQGLAVQMTQPRHYRQTLRESTHCLSEVRPISK